MRYERNTSPAVVLLLIIAFGIVSLYLAYVSFAGLFLLGSQMPLAMNLYALAKGMAFGLLPFAAAYFFSKTIKAVTIEDNAVLIEPLAGAPIRIQNIRRIYLKEGKAGYEFLVIEHPDGVARISMPLDFRNYKEMVSELERVSGTKLGVLKRWEDSQDPPSITGKAP